MHAQRAVPFLALRDHLLADHHVLESVLERLLAAFEANDREDVARLWTELESGLLAHLDAEEKYVLPSLLAAYPREARVIVGDHKHIRTRLAEIGTAIELHVIRLEYARDFIDELRAHARNEDRLLYQWAEAHLDEPQRASLLAALAPAAQG